MALIVGTIPLIIGWILIMFADSVAMLLVARVAGGISMGFGFSALPMYLAEVSSTKIRGTVTTLLAVMLKFGILYAFVIGPYVSVAAMAGIALIPAGLFLLSFIWFPESPYYLLAKKRNLEALKNLQKLRGHEDVVAELHRMDAFVQKSAVTRATLREIFSKETRMSFVIIIVVGCIQHLCGGQAVLGYAEIIFDQINSGVRGSEATILLGFLQLISAIIGVALMDVAGRKPLLLVAGIGTAVCNAIIGAYFFLERKEVDTSEIGWIPLTALMVFIICYNIGMTTVPFALLGEMFPKHLKAIAAGICTTTAASVAFAVGKLYQVVADELGNDVAFWAFAVFSFMFIPFVIFVIPETKGKPLDVILDILNGRKTNDDGVNNRNNSKNTKR